VKKWREKEEQDCRRVRPSKGRFDTDEVVCNPLCVDPSWPHTAIVWSTNSGFIPTSNGEPMFTNVYCGQQPPTAWETAWAHNSKPIKSRPTLPMSRAPSSKTNADVVSWTGEEWSSVSKRGKNFDVPGVDTDQTGGVMVLQPLWLNCSVDADTPTDYIVAIRSQDGDILESHQGTTDTDNNPDNDGCGITLDNIPPDTRYELVAFSLEEGKRISEMTFDVTVHYYDGIPSNMNNKSYWLGPELDLGVKSIRPFIFLNFFGMTFFFLLYPASYYWERVENAKNEVEEKFPDFLRDLAEYWKGGLSMTVAIQTLATSEYGALNDEVKKMSDQLSWGIKFSDVIKQFADRVGTPLVQRAIALIAEADRAGGKISDILVTAANDSRELKFLEGERKRAIGSYIAVIWTSYFVFLGVIVTLAVVFIPAIAGSNSSGEDGGDSGGQTIGNMTIRNIDPLFFLTVFYYGVTMQAVGNGTMAGLMSTGRFSTGFKHSGMMILVSIVVFNFLAFTPNLIGVTEVPGLNPSTGTFIPSPLFFG
jgi:flagellar protein FlaJ